MRRQLLVDGGHEERRATALLECGPDFALLPLPLYLALLLVEAATLFSLVGYSTPAWASQCAPCAT